MRQLVGLAVGTMLAAASVAFVAYEAWMWGRAAVVVDAGTAGLGSSSGGVRPGAVYLNTDSYYWLGYAKRIGEGDVWRVRQTMGDNAPYGRPVHWSQSISWLMVTFGKARQWLTGASWQEALEVASVWVNPALLLFLICGLGWPLWRRVGPVSAGLFMVYLVSLHDIAWEFHPLRPDHQSLQVVFGMFVLAGLVFGGAGWIRSDAEGEQRKSWFLTRPLEVPGQGSAVRWFLISGAAAALLLWVSAVVATLLLGMLFAGVLLVVWRAPEAKEGVVVRPELWRWWGWTAGAGSLLLYLVEYFPNHLGLRLEVNGPLYSVMAWAMGEALCQFLRVREADTPASRKAAWVKGLGCTVAVAVAPAAILLGPANWHALRDPEMFRLHSIIQEFYSLPKFAAGRPGELFLRNFGILPLFILLGVGLAGLARLRLYEWTVLGLSLVFTLGMLGLAYLQVRWLGLFAAMNVWLAVVAGLCGWRLLCDRLRSAGWQTAAAVLLVIALLVQPVFLGARRIAEVRRIAAQRALPYDLMEAVLNKRFALELRAAEGPGARIMADPDIAPALQYFADASAVVSFYWENLDGLHAASRFFADRNGEAARQVAAERGLTHVVVKQDGRWLDYFYFVATGKSDPEAAQATLAAKLAADELMLPGWIRTSGALSSLRYQRYEYRGVPFENRWRPYRIQLAPSQP